MTLPSGSKLGPYEIISPLGAGGMGEVYRARDTRLDREVALKLLPTSSLGDAAARARLIEEAKTASSLNHPHVCTIHEVGEADSHTYVAMEFVEGRPLSWQILHDGLPLELVLRYGGQIADALAYAHEHGIVHRDLKSANVMITPDGRTKVLDFGLARRLAGNELSEATLSKRSLEDSEEISGTLQYMAPEALRGEPSDARSDIWALGVVLYEMSAGHLPFSGKTAYELTSAILREPPPPFPPSIPSGLRSVIQRCLAKESGQRYSRIGEVRSALEAIGYSETLTAAAAPSSKEGPPSRLSRNLTILGALVAITLLALVLRGRFAASESGSTKPGEVTDLGGPRANTGLCTSANKEANEYFERAILFESGQYQPEHARQLLEHALQLDPHFAEARAWYAMTFFQMVDGGLSNDSAMYYKAEEEVRRALQDNPNCARPHYVFANLLLERGRKREGQAENGNGAAA
jgi:serine/threonine protein kinase